MTTPPARKTAARTTRTTRTPRKVASRAKVPVQSPIRAPHLSPAERAARGKAARLALPRAEQGDFDPSTRGFDPVDVLERQSAQRVQELIPLRYSRMSEAPFRFYRGAAAIMAADLALSPNTGIQAQLCGDAHMLNFRLLGSAERRLMFDINDFDETHPGPWEWDLKRLTTSLVIAARANGWSKKIRSGLVLATAKSYRDWMHRFATMGNLDVWYASADIERLKATLDALLTKRARRVLEASEAAAKTRDNLKAFNKLTAVVDGQHRFVGDPPLLTPMDQILPDVERRELEDVVAGLLDRYASTLSTDRQKLLEQFQFVDLARKVVGVGSVGTRCWVVLLLGRDSGDPLLLQLKEASQSVLAEHVGASEYDNQGQRVVAGQRLMQAAGDIFLGWERLEGLDGKERDFYVRQLHDWKAIPVAETMVPSGMKLFGSFCGADLARAHARSGDRIAIASYLGSSDVFDQALVRFAEAYADQNERDHAALLVAGEAGRITIADPLTP
jgi:Uncharacterized protein conserved in bacteria (DUF2252)